MNRDNTTTDLASLIVGELIERGLVPNCQDTDDPRELEVQDAISDAIKSTLHPLSLMLWEAAREHPVLPGVFDQALRIGLDNMAEEKDEWLEENKDKLLFVEPHLWHRLMGRAKDMFDDLYS
jgi:hypothetical protein